METFTFYWLTGDKDIGKGSTPADALTKLGYGGGATRALDFYANGENDDYEFKNGKWTKKHPFPEIEAVANSNDIIYENMKKDNISDEEINDFLQMINED